MPGEPQHQTGQVIVAHCFSVLFLTVTLGTAIRCSASPGSAVSSMQLAPARCPVPGKLVHPGGEPAWLGARDINLVRDRHRPSEGPVYP